MSGPPLRVCTVSDGHKSHFASCTNHDRAAETVLSTHHAKIILMLCTPLGRLKKKKRILEGKATRLLQRSVVCGHWSDSPQNRFLGFIQQRGRLPFHDYPLFFYTAHGYLRERRVKLQYSFLQIWYIISYFIPVTQISLKTD